MRKWLSIWALLIGIPITLAWAANTSLSNLSASGAISGTDLVYVVQTPGSGGVKGTAAKIATYINSLFSGDCTATSGGVLTCTKINGNAVPASAATNQLLVGTGVSTFSLKTVPDCTDTGGNHINYTQSSNAFSCGTSGGGGGSGQTLHPGYVATRWYPTVQGTYAAGTAVSGNSIKLQAFMVTQAITLSNIGARLTTAAAAGNVQLAIYASNATTKYPTGTALCSTASLSTTSTGNITGTCSTSLTAGTLYYSAINADATAGSTAIFQIVTVAANQNSWLIGGTTQNAISSAATNGELVILVTQTFNTWPDLTNTASPAQSESASAGFAHVQINVASVP